jgi:hypothetical protein
VKDLPWVSVGLALDIRTLTTAFVLLSRKLSPVPTFGALTMQLSFQPSLSPTWPAETPQSFCGRLLTWCASQELRPLFSLSPLLAAIPSEASPILLFAPAPFSGVTLRIWF